MTTITFFKDNTKFIGLNSIGHADYRKYGDDIVCSAISTITQSLALGILKVVKIKAKYLIDDDKGKLELRLPRNIDNDKLVATEVLFKTAFMSLKDLEKGYPSNIKVEVKTYDVY